MPLYRTVYMSAPHVQQFVKYLSDIVAGTIPINFTVGFSRNKLPAGFEQKFPGEPGTRGGGGPVHVVFAQTLEELFRMYWWDRKDYSENKVALDNVCIVIKAAIAGENDDRGQEYATQACHEVMKWGFGKGRRPYEANMRWAKSQGEALGQILRVGRESLTGAIANIEAFGSAPDVESGQPKMNAGWTKYYALALPNHVIYDGRVGAALGLLVRRYLESRPPLAQATSVPEELRFPWADGDGGGKSRNPSSAQYEFGRLYGGAHGSKAWARANVCANWVLERARQNAQASWCSGADGLRRLEAALFMLGYDLSRADEWTPVADAA